MTHGEEPGSETHQDSAVLTYLEGVLMHQVGGGPGATGTRRSEASGRDGQEQRALPPLPSGHGTANQEQDRRAPAGGASQHPKKARLLRSEGWAGEPGVGGRRSLGAEPTLNGGGGEQHQHGGALEGSPKCKGGESTLLASLLQSFSSRLQTVALSQQIMQSLKQPEPAPLDRSTTAEPRPCLGAASSRLKGFLKKSKMQNHASVPYRRRAVPERPAESLKATNVAAATASSSASDSLSCVARLKAVASLVNTRSSPAPSSPAPSPSPRPSVACSQLALLLSSEAHLQQYSREQLSGRTASERLAAMATQQTQQDPGKQEQPAPDVLGSLNTRNGTLSPPGRGTGGGAASPQTMPQPLKERRGFDRNSARPSQNCSSLLLHLLNNHNAQKQANNRPACPSRGSPLLSDSESNPETSFPRDSSDTESSCSSSSPIDLSVRSRIAGPLVGSSSSASSSFSSSSSLDKLTESLINRWRPENPPPTVVEEKEPETGALVRPHHKITLLQLLLDHRNSEGNRAKRTSDNPDLRQGAKPSSVAPKPSSVAPKPSSVAVGLSVGVAGGVGVAAGVGVGVAEGVGVVGGKLTPVSRCEESPHSRPASRSFQTPPSNGSVSHYSKCPPPPTQSTPLNLCKSNPPSNPEPALSASKLLQNLAQCGLQSSVPSPPINTPLPPAKLRLDPPITLLERLNTPVSDIPLSPFMSNGSPALDTPRTNPPSEIESLLERRTVLQLLLGATGNKDKSLGSGRRKRAACGGVPSEQRLDESNRCSNSPEIKIKTEPSEDRAEPHPNRGGGESPLSAPHRGEVKPEPVSPGAVARDGLLSQLLKQQCRKLPVNTPTAGGVKEEPGEPQTPPIPKKRRLCAEGFPQERPVSAVGVNRGNYARGFISGSPDRLATRNGVSPTEADSPGRGRVGDSPPTDARGSFNVLKQLLLSDNCLKDLSHPQPRGSPSPSALHPPECRVNGDPSSRPGHPSHELVTSHWDHAPQGTGVADHTHSASPPWGVRDSPKVNLVPVKREAEAEGPVRWAVGVGDSPDHHPDSPRLTKANPILYYMLQKGSGYLGRDRRGLRAGPCRGGAPAQPRVKEETTAHTEGDDHKLNTKHHLHLPEQAPEGANERLNGSLKKC
ncbi:hypothetical protein SKAU_G00182560 [Synaphobranchus kaupii]|uniref:Nuclear receptor interacting protein 1 n=1 Tax=Synaphobranchus kaupii TaxID=118154 RepID=A0A9Q1IUD6_SYNKA|nr:hypothetical protein SKAU_G00182560 [Synaphobranchus kaupii]